MMVLNPTISITMLHINGLYTPNKAEIVTLDYKSKTQHCCLQEIHIKQKDITYLHLFPLVQKNVIIPRNRTSEAAVIDSQSCTSQEVNFYWIIPSFGIIRSFQVLLFPRLQFNLLTIYQLLVRNEKGFFFTNTQ